MYKLAQLKEQVIIRPYSYCNSNVLMLDCYGRLRKDKQYEVFALGPLLTPITLQGMKLIQNYRLDVYYNFKLN